MPIAVYNESQWQELILSYLQQKYRGKRTDPQSFLGQQAQAFGQFCALISKAILDADMDGIPAYQAVNGVLASRNSTQALDNWSFTFGLPSNRGAGQYGRNGAQAATGGGGTVYGTPGTIVSAGDTLVDASGQITVELVGGVTVGVGGSIAGSFQATTTGAAGNLQIGAILYWTSPPPGLAASVTLSAALSGGYDVEDDLTLLGRLIRHLQAPPKGGTAADYRAWAESSTNLTTGAALGIIRAFVYAHRSGLGTEDIVITQGGSGPGRAPTTQTQTLCQAFLDSVRPANDTPTAVLPYFNPAQGLNLQLLARTQPSYAFDWNLSGGIAIQSATTTTITVFTSDITGTQLAAALAAGRTPRVQVLIPGTFPNPTPLPYVATVLASATSGGNTILTCALNADGSNPFPTAPSGRIWPAGPAVMPVALAVLAYIDSVGPSQQSGFQDSITDAWEALVSIGRIAQSALDAVDSGGQRVLVYSPSVGTGVGVTIAVGSGAASGSDYTLYDNVPNQGPQLPWTASILVLPA